MERGTLHAIPESSGEENAALTPPVILIVEDEPLLRMIISEHLADAGYSVVEAENADDALQALERRSDILLMLTDVRMPGSMDGFGLANLVAARWKKIRVFVTSGHATADEGTFPSGAQFIPKPFGLVDLECRLRATL